MEYPLVTVVTLTYKQFDYIYSTINSVLKQNYPSIEYIIADDGSLNFPKEEIENFVKDNAKENIKNFFIVDGKENVGTVKNINRAYKMAKGEYLMPLSGDDEFFDENSISNVINEFVKRKCDALITSRLVCSKDLEPLYYIPHFKIRKKIDSIDTREKQYKAMVTYEFYEVMSGSVLYIRKCRMEEMGFFDEGYKLLEDAPFFERFLRQEKIEIAYDIVSIKYRAGGVSFEKMNPILRKDFEKYNNLVLEENFNIKDKDLKRKIQYTNSFIGHSSGVERIICYLKKPDIYIKKVVYRIRKKIYKLSDKRYINAQKLKIKEDNR